MAPDYARDAQDTNNALIEEARRIREALGLEAVRIVATGEVAPHHSQCYTGGHGNWHAQYGAMAEVMASMDIRLGEPPVEAQRGGD